MPGNFQSLVSINLHSVMFSIFVMSWSNQFLMENIMSQTTIFLSLNIQIHAINTSDYEHKWHINTLLLNAIHDAFLNINKYSAIFVCMMKCSIVLWAYVSNVCVCVWERLREWKESEMTWEGCGCRGVSKHADLFRYQRNIYFIWMNDFLYRFLYMTLSAQTPQFLLSTS